MVRVEDPEYEVVVGVEETDGLWELTPKEQPVVPHGERDPYPLVGPC